MERTQLEIRYSSPSIGYASETVTASTVQGGINLIKMRVPDMRIDSVRVLPSPTSDQNSSNSGRRY